LQQEATPPLLFFFVAVVFCAADEADAAASVAAHKRVMANSLTFFIVRTSRGEESVKLSQEQRLPGRDP